LGAGQDNAAHRSSRSCESDDATGTHMRVATWSGHCRRHTGQPRLSFRTQQAPHERDLNNGPRPQQWSATSTMVPARVPSQKAVTPGLVDLVPKPPTTRPRYSSPKNAHGRILGARVIQDSVHTCGRRAARVACHGATRRRFDCWVPQSVDSFHRLVVGGSPAASPSAAKPARRAPLGSQHRLTS